GQGRQEPGGAVAGTSTGGARGLRARADSRAGRAVVMPRVYPGPVTVPRRLGARRRRCARWGVGKQGVLGRPAGWCARWVVGNPGCSAAWRGGAPAGGGGVTRARSAARRG